MANERYVLLLIEDGSFSTEGRFIGYWTGTKHWADGVCFPGAMTDKHDKRVKVYTSKKRAENAVSKLKEHFTFVKNAHIETLDY